MSYIFPNIFTRDVVFSRCVVCLVIVLKLIIFSHEVEDKYAYLERKSWLYSEEDQFSNGFKIHTQFEIKIKAYGLFSGFVH